MELVEFTNKKEKVYINPFFVTGIMSCDKGRALQGSIEGGTDICMFGEAHISVDQDVEKVKKAIENASYYNMTVIADALKTAMMQT